jgi:hypothetical protein
MPMKYLMRVALAHAGKLKNTARNYPENNFGPDKSNF